MSFSYIPTNINPRNTVPDLVSPIRWLVQDIDSATAELSDEEINGLLAGQDVDVDQLTKVYRVASQLAHGLWRRYTKQASFSSGGTQVDLKGRAAAWEAVYKELVALAAAAEADGENEFGTVLQPARDSQFPLWIADWPSSDPGLDL